MTRFVTVVFSATLWCPANTNLHGAQPPLAPAPPPPPPASSTSSNVLYAVMALLGELDEESLRIVHKEVEQRLS